MKDITGDKQTFFVNTDSAKGVQTTNTLNIKFNIFVTVAFFFYMIFAFFFVSYMQGFIALIAFTFMSMVVQGLKVFTKSTNLFALIDGKWVKVGVFRKEEAERHAEVMLKKINGLEV